MAVAEPIWQDELMGVVVRQITTIGDPFYAIFRGGALVISVSTEHQAMVLGRQEAARLRERAGLEEE